jgi:uncharacterized protein YaiI (UPF0178 family)
MTIWVDADACPRVVKDMLFRAAKRTQHPLVLVANQWLATPPSPWIRAVVVGAGMDVADQYIVDHLVPGDLVITADLPLAALVIDAGGKGLNPRGEFYSADNVRAALSMRDFMTDLRSIGVDTGGPAAIGQRDLQIFAGQLDKWLAQTLSQIKSSASPLDRI